MIFSLGELADVIIMTLAVGYIFSSIFKHSSLGMDKNAFLFACLVTAPALIFHELAHKFVAMGFGLNAEFHAAYVWLAIGIIMRLINFNFIFFVPAYVSIGAGMAQVTPLTTSLIAFAGPFMNLVLFTIAWALLHQKKIKKNTYLLLYITKQINLFLFIFNMLPIPGFDGLKVYQGLFNTFF